MQLVVDWDGTVTERDTLQQMLAHFVEPAVFDALEAETDAGLAAGTITHREVMEREFEPCKRGALPDGLLVYVGDGYSDRCAALAADRIFARDGLARYLDERGVRYEPFTDFHQLV